MKKDKIPWKKLLIIACSLALMITVGMYTVDFFFRGILPDDRLVEKYDNTGWESILVRGEDCWTEVVSRNTEKRFSWHFEPQGVVQEYWIHDNLDPIDTEHHYYGNQNPTNTGIVNFQWKVKLKKNLPSNFDRLTVRFCRDAKQ